MKVEKTCSINKHRYDFTSGGYLFLCKSGLDCHWDIAGVTKLTARLSDTPSVDSMAFTTKRDKYGSYHITIKPDVGENWSERHHDTYKVFSQMLKKFAKGKAVAHGYMSLIIED